MKYKKILIFFVLFQTEKSYSGIFDIPSTMFKYTANLVTTGGKGCARCGTPYNVSCMDQYGNNKEIYNKPIESCFQVTAGGCRPRDGAMEEARKYCAGKGLILNESDAGKKEQARGVSNSQLKSMQKVVDNVMDTAMPAATLALGAVAGASVVGAPAIQGAISSSTAMRDQNLQKSSLKIQNKLINKQEEGISSPYHQNEERHYPQLQHYSEQQPFQGQGQRYPEQQPFQGQGQRYPEQQPFQGQGQHYPEQQPFQGQGQGQHYPEQQPFQGQGQHYPEQQPSQGQGQHYPEQYSRGK
ncbi:hypothetical protein [Holospora undulata]|nr:hypothetical protein [Holospora undulata]